MKKLQSMAVLILLLAATGCGGGAIAPRQAAESAVPAVSVSPSDASSAPAASAAPVAPSPQASAVPASPSPEPSPSPAASAQTQAQAQPSTKPAGTSSQDNKQLWAKIDKSLQDEDYETIAALVKAVSNPDEELKAMYLFAQYNIYGQDGDDAKSVEALYQIPDTYQGRHADLIAYWKYVHESFEAGKTDNVTFDEFKTKYYKPGKSAE
ncbi:hypothetical protein KIH86_22215 [Paenibacillus sp. HN-1]|uniref:hypothetical protein n=1 Tax=Paenibacillus TaxID=44249 RepID=UPI001CA8E9D4|nr:MULTISPECIES: hypothetical protein [Paenibacillus]MBY9079132.1 hypothetical protein [Paenibacillus sp. CGMCC 1.18879]MBY9086910.1 hypothetical protein [Paenibacillus sinensis]